MARACPQCGATYGDDVTFCPEDGVRLGAAPPPHARATVPADDLPPGADEERARALDDGRDDEEETVDEDDELLGRSIGSYQILKLLGRGGMGGVYLAHHPVIGSKVAIKFLHQRFSNDKKIVDRFFNEARAVNLIGHDNILKILDLNVTEDGRHYFVMELLQGKPLQSLVEGGQPVPLAVAGPILLQFCEALQAAHEKKIFHRDVKPDNVYLVVHKGRKNFVKVVDFGIAKLTDAAGGAGATGRTQTGMVIGTPAYMSPEQAGGLGHKIDARSDVYSAGVMMFQLATGQLPFPGESFGEVLIGHLQLAPPDPCSLNPDLSPDYAKVILKALEKRQEDRWQSMRELGAQVLACMEAQGIANELPAADGEDPSHSSASSHVTPGFHQGTPAPLRRPKPVPRFGAAEVVSPRKEAPRRSGHTLSTRVEKQDTSPTAAQPAPAPPPRSRAPVLLGLAVGGALLVAGVVGWMALSGGDAAEREGHRVARRAAEAAAEAVARANREAQESAEKEAPVLLSVVSDPIGASVEATWKDGGRKTGTTPLDFRVPRGAKVTFVFTHRGRVPYRQDVLADEAQVVRANLVADGRPARPAESRKPPKAPRPPKQTATGDDVIEVGDEIFDK